MKPLKQEFLFHHKDGYDKLHAIGMSLADMAIEPAYIARKLYAGIKKRNPVQAEFFRKMVIEAVNSPQTWDVSKAPEQDLEIYIPFTGETKAPN